MPAKETWRVPKPVVIVDTSQSYDMICDADDWLSFTWHTKLNNTMELEQKQELNWGLRIVQIQTWDGRKVVENKHRPGSKEGGFNQVCFTWFTSGDFLSRPAADRIYHRRSCSMVVEMDSLIWAVECQPPASTRSTDESHPARGGRWRLLWEEHLKREEGIKVSF